MSVGEQAPETATPQGLRSAQTLSAIIVPLVAVAAAVGLFVPEFYRDTDWVVPQNRGTDLVTLLLAVPAMVVTLLALRRGSAQAAVVLVGLLGYVFYIYTGATFAYAMNELFLVYVALFSLSIFALVAAVAGIDIARLQQRLDSGVPRRAVAVFLAFIAFLLTALWLKDIIPFLTAGKIPEAVTLAAVPTFFVYGLDLGLVVPLAVLGAVWLWRRSPWGYVLAGAVLIKAATMGLALLAMTWFGIRAGLATELELTLSYILIAAGGLGMSVWHLRHCRG